jgi:preprotein translocase subunit SecE
MAIVKTGTLDGVKGTPAPRPLSRGGSGSDDSGVLRRPTAWWDRSRTFLTEVRNEMKRVTWPSSREVYATTLVVILVSAFFGLYLWSLDLGLSWVVNWIFQKFGAA